MTNKTVKIITAILCILVVVIILSAGIAVDVFLTVRAYKREFMANCVVHHTEKDCTTTWETTDVSNPLDIWLENSVKTVKTVRTVGK